MAVETPSPPGAEAGSRRTARESRQAPHRWAIFTAIAVLAVAAVGGGAFLLLGDSSSDHPAVPAPNTDREREAVVEAVLGFARIAHEANDPVPNPNHPQLATYATGRALESLTSSARENQVKGIGVRKAPNSRTQHKIEVLSVTGSAATARDCSVDDGLVVELSTGRVLNADVVTRLETVFLTKEGDRWKVSAIQVDQRWNGVAGCAGS